MLKNDEGNPYAAYTRLYWHKTITGAVVWPQFAFCGHLGDIINKAAAVTRPDGR